LKPDEFLKLIEHDPASAKEMLLRVIVRSALDGCKWEAAVWLLNHFWPNEYSCNYKVKCL
jgi:hypothetical protein